MNYRRALRASTDTGLAIFLIMIVGVVLWTTDEVLNWNILPDWIDKFAQVLVIVLSILAGFAVIISVMCSFAVLAESAAEKAGIASPPPSRRTRSLIAIGILLAFGLMFGLHKLDQYRAGQRRQADEQKALGKYLETQNELETRMPNIVALFSPEIRQFLGGAGTEAGDEALARLLKAIHSSTPFNPEVSVIVNAEAPFRYCVISAVSEPRQSPPEPTPKFLRRQFLTDLPNQWEDETITAIFRGEKPTVQRDQQGVFIDYRKPSAWGIVAEDRKVVAVVMLRGTGWL